MIGERNRSILRAFCAALIPAHEGRDEPGRLLAAGASDLNAADAVEDALSHVPARQQRLLAGILRFIDNPLTSLLWIAKPVRFSRLPVADATKYLEAMSTSRVPLARRAFDALKRVVLLQAYGSEVAQRTIWREKGYLLRQGADASPIGRDELPEHCETVVIGSGAGGGVAAARLAQLGREVLVLEKGPEVLPNEMSGIESEAMGRMFEQGGLMATADGGISLFAGSCLGGGTTVNWSASFRIPEVTRLRWARFHGIDWMAGDTLSEAYQVVESRTGIGLDVVDDNPQNAALRRGCRELGLPVRTVLRNTRHCEGSAARDCGRCGLGCAAGRKLGMTNTFLPDLKELGGRIVTGVEVDEVATSGGRVVGVDVHVRNGSEREKRRIRTDRVVLAAGALHTPAILLRSGMPHEQIGRNLFLHPTVGVAGRYRQPIRGWEGPIMSAFTEAFATMDGPWGVRIETPPIYPGLFASALPWNDALTHKEDLNQIERTAAFIVLTRDRSSGTAGLDGEGNLRVDYQIADADLAMMLTGVVEAVRIHLAAGAESVVFPYSLRKTIEARNASDRVADLARDIFTWGWRPGLYPLFSAHQMGTCRMGGDARRYPVDPEGRLRGVDGLYVCDASLFPEASGVNPALTVQAIARCVADQIQ